MDTTEAIIWACGTMTAIGIALFLYRWYVWRARRHVITRLMQAAFEQALFEIHRDARIAADKKKEAENVKN